MFKEYFKRIQKDYFKEFNIIDKIWASIATALVFAAVIIGWDHTAGTGFINIIIAIGSITGTWCVLLVNKQKISNYAFGVLNVVCFGIMYAMFGMWGMSFVNLIYFLPLQFIGFYQWFRKETNPDIVKVRWETRKELIIYCITTVAGIIFVYNILGLIPGLFTAYDIGLPVAEGTLRWLDASGTVGNMIAQILMNAALCGQWVYWWIIDLTQLAAFSILLVEHGFSSYYLSMFIMYCIWTVNATLGFINWTKSIRQEKNGTKK